MNRIKEILSEKGITVNELALRLNKSRQSLSRQLQGKMLVETAEEIADAIGVELWELFAPPREVIDDKLIAYIHFGSLDYAPTTIEEAMGILKIYNEKEFLTCCNRYISEQSASEMSASEEINTPENKHVSEKLRVKELLREKGLTSKELAKKIGMSTAGLSLTINEGGNPSLKRLQQIADVLCVGVKDLFE